MRCPKCQTDNPDTQKYCGECATPLQPSRDVSVTKTIKTPVVGLTRGTMIAGRYEVIEELGIGGMGQVFRALDIEINEEVALKLIKPEIAADERTIERFRNELKIARKISHENVCRMYHFSKEEDTPYVTMEYVSGINLKNLIKKKEKLPREEALSIAKQVAEGLVVAHKLGVIHRDLKPQNIMIDENGCAKIMDFGIARSLEAPGVTASGVIIGTPDYMSPEQAEGKVADQRSDIYSLGVILYEMVTGTVPFQEDTALSVALKHKAQIPEKPRKLNPEVSEDLSRLILVCLEKEKDRRYQTAQDLLEDLKNVEEGLPLGTKIWPKRKTFVSILIQKKLFMPTMVVCLAVLAIVLWQLFLNQEVVSPEQEIPSIAVLSFEDMSSKKDQEYLCDGFATSIINALHKIRELRVPARTSTFYFKGKEREIEEIGKKLNVKTVLEGSLQKEGNRMRITTQLINVADESLLWSEQYDREYDDVFDMQDEITLAVVDKLKVAVLGTEKVQLVKRYTENVEAYNHYLRGNYERGKLAPDSFDKSLKYFQAAVENDPGYALAYGGMANLYVNWLFWANLPPNQGIPKAREAAQKALELDETIPDAHIAMAMIYTYYDWNWEEAEREFNRALELDPKSASAYSGIAFLFLITKREEEAISKVKIALELDPLSNETKAWAAHILWEAQRYDEVIEKTNEWLEIDPSFYQFHLTLGLAYHQKGILTDAIKEYEKVQDLYPGESLSLLYLGGAYYQLGRENEAEEIFKGIIERAEQEYCPPVDIAFIHRVRGDLDESVRWFEKALEEHDIWLPLYSVPAVRHHIHPRFEFIYEKMGLE